MKQLFPDLLHSLLWRLVAQRGFVDRIGTILVICAVSVAIGAGQPPSPTPMPTISPLDGTTPGINTPGAPAESYHLSSIEHLNYANGNLGISIPLVDIPGRGQARTSFILNVQRPWVVKTIQGAYACVPGQSQQCLSIGYLPLLQSWQNAAPTVSNGVMLQRSMGDFCANLCSNTTGPNGFCNTSGNENYDKAWSYTTTQLTFASPDGTEHDFRDTITGGSKQRSSSVTNPFTSQFGRGPLFQAYDGRGAVYIPSQNINDVQRGGCIAYDGGSPVGSGTMILRDGTKYAINSGYVSEIEDKNGNKMTLTNSADTINGAHYYDKTLPLVVVDALGRTTTAYPQTTDSQVIAYPYPDSPCVTPYTTGCNPSNHRIVITYKYLDQVLAPGETLQPTEVLFSAISAGTQADFCLSTAQQYGLTTTLANGQTVITSSYRDANGSIRSKLSEAASPSPTDRALSCGWQSDAKNMVASVAFPGSSTDAPADHTYSFLYDKYGNVARIMLPTGGMYAYEYFGNLYTTGGTITDFGPTGSGGTYPSGYVIQNSLTKKSIYTNASDSAPSQVITYKPVNGAPGSSPDSGEVQYQDGTKEKHFTYSVNTSPPIDGTAYKNWNEGKEYKVDYLDLVGSTLRSEVSTWEQMSCDGGAYCSWFGSSQGTPEYNPRVSVKQTTLGSATAIEKFAYDIYNNATEKDECDFGSTTANCILLTKTLTTYKTLQNDPAYINTPTHILNLPVTQTVYGPLSSSPVAKTNSFYDAAGSLDTVAGAVTAHDSSYGTGFVTRGNLTSVDQYLGDSQTGVNTSKLTTSYRYDILGNLTQAKDPRGVQHDYGYTDAGTAASGNSTPTYALLTSVKSYTAVNGGGTALTASVAYDYNLGKPTSTTDVNSNLTSYAYNDPMGLDRLTDINAPDGGWTTFAYHDDYISSPPTPIYVRKTIGTTSGTPITTQTNYDGLGRSASTTVDEGGGCVVQINFGYDNRGRQSLVSLPLRTNAPSMSCAGQMSAEVDVVTAFDGINRPLTITQGGTAPIQKRYISNQTFEMDPAGFTKLSTSDALGRLTQVEENRPASGLNVSPALLPVSGGPTIPAKVYTTTYSYDGLSNLLGVHQTDPDSLKQVNRSFIYDSLKRLGQSTNPENGTITYTYDASGNLQSRKDARVITLSFDPYDGLNRITRKSYDDSKTPAVTFGYNDTSSTCNLKGRLRSVTTTTTGGTMTSNYSCYDSLGRITLSDQVIAGTTYPFTGSCPQSVISARRATAAERSSDRSLR